MLRIPPYFSTPVSSTLVAGSSALFTSALYRAASSSGLTACGGGSAKNSAPALAAPWQATISSSSLVKALSNPRSCSASASAGSSILDLATAAAPRLVISTRFSSSSSSSSSCTSCSSASRPVSDFMTVFRSCIRESFLKSENNSTESRRYLAKLLADMEESTAAAAAANVSSISSNDKFNNLLTQQLERKLKEMETAQSRRCGLKSFFVRCRKQKQPERDEVDDFGTVAFWMAVFFIMCGWGAHDHLVKSQEEAERAAAQPATSSAQTTTASVEDNDNKNKGGLGKFIALSFMFWCVGVQAYCAFVACAGALLSTWMSAATLIPAVLVL